jgi:hypothetical protein
MFCCWCLGSVQPLLPLAMCCTYAACFGCDIVVVVSCLPASD